ncbi:CRISPR-associated helicase/endonuclease Cas3 [Neisseria chenwenguii]|uniref:CRISPR-associated helicase/endonuclease Cas3 n=1 Tax=Neisseria chenwenguii TaxID=1853278 RepID=A0A220S386_9NEIS|nr:CRISPR-associated helicase/endonuclease Cas3 [Neisseria chenwenguii]ASK27934.1 CRISPR-associated helicase/endonuclease Cas3 [Neisseria chenwenguii]
MQEQFQPYYAHSAENRPESEWQTLSSHLTAVGQAAAEFSAFFGAQEIARYTGLLHDLGKYSARFQQRLRGGKPVNHSTAGAKIAVKTWGNLGNMMAFCIAGHHAGLADGAGSGNGRTVLNDRLKEAFGADIPELDPIWQAEIGGLPEKLAATPPVLPKIKELQAFSRAFYTRMLYSCLVDADFLDTEKFYLGLENQTPARGSYPSLEQLQQRFQAFLDAFRQKTAQNRVDTPELQRNAGLNRLRSEILDHAVAQAGLPPGLFTLTVPTGGGKTFTSMAFALKHALAHDLRRVIYVIPFTSIIEQNAAEFRKAFGDLGEAAVLEHHSTFNDETIQDRNSRDKLHRASENWDMPIVVTTAVQFFESLFADRSSRCRKLHNITGSVIILDEVQMLPPKLLQPILAAIDELARNYRCTVVLCTATQPALHKVHYFQETFAGLRELAPNPPELFKQLQRATVRHIGLQNDDALQEKLAEHPQILIIVNNRRHARSLYDQVKTVHSDGLFHLTTLMCAAHRQNILAEIKGRLKNGQPCRVIATSLIEAGVDVDFPVVMRAESGLDSVAQAAGRCNREGKNLPENSPVYVFQTAEEWKTPPELAVQAAAMRSVFRNDAHRDLLSPPAITQYFKELYCAKGTALDDKQILHTIHANGPNFPFQTVAEKFRMIENHMQPVIVPFDAKAEELIDALRHADHIGGLLRKLQPYTVQIPEKALDALYAAGRIEALNEAKFGRQFWCLIGLDLYDETAGLSWEDADFLKAESMII